MRLVNLSMPVGTFVVSLDADPTPRRARAQVPGEFSGDPCQHEGRGASRRARRLSEGRAVLRPRRQAAGAARSKSAGLRKRLRTTPVCVGRLLPLLSAPKGGRRQQRVSCEVPLGVILAPTRR
jgi:hypothetical protein